MESKQIALIVIILFVLSRMRKIRKLKSELKIKNLEIENHQKTIKQLQTEKTQSESQKNDYIQKESDIENELLLFPENFYYMKHSCMNQNESRMFYYINCALDDLIPSDQRSNYFVFPQVSLHAFIGIHTGVQKIYLKNKLATRNMVAKNVDYIICQRVKDGSNYYDYKPIVIIELDGSSHYSSSYGTEVLARQQASDKFKDMLFDSLSLPLVRYHMDITDHVIREDRYRIKQHLQKYFLP